MKLLFTIPCFLSLAPLLFSFPLRTSSHMLVIIMNDTVPSVHTTDGLANEWKMDMFYSDHDTTVFTAIDNDDNALYAILAIPEFSMQSKLMRNGMKLFIDLKAKKKTGHGVEFPISEEVNNFIKSNFSGTSREEAGQSQQDGKKQYDKKMLRQIMSLGMVSMKIFGFTAVGNEQGLKIPGSINIAFKWDTNDVMHIEYSIPFKLLNIQPADRSEVDTGWTVNGTQRLQNTNREEGDGEGSHHYSGGEGGGGNGGGRGGYGGHRGGGGYGNSSSQRKMTAEEMMKEQTYWIKYTLVDVKKAF